MKLIDAQPEELAARKRLAPNYASQKKLEADAARPILDWKLDYFTVWPHVKNLIPHQSIYNFGRMHEVWIDKERSAREDVHRAAARHRRADLGRHVAGHLRAAPARAR